MESHALTIRTFLALLGLVASMRVAAGGNVVDRTIQEIMAPRAPDQGFCYDAPRYSETGKSSWAIAFVATTTRAYIKGVCQDHIEGEELAIYRIYDQRYREIKVIRAGDGTLTPTLIRYNGTATNPMPEVVLLGIENSLSGTGNFREYELYRIADDDTLVPIPITSAAELLTPRLAKGQGIVGPGYVFEDFHVGFGMSITNGNESVRFPEGGSAYGDMILVRGVSGLTLAPDPESLQMPSDSNRLNQLALTAYRAEKYDEALDYYRQALDRDRRNHEAAANLGLLYIRRKEWNAAIEISTRVAETRDASRAIRASAAYNAGRAFEYSGDSRRARAWYRRSIAFQDTPERRAALARVCPGPDDCT
ncbi:MAG TPA: tetratricopeptide repeat protein [Steroidobacteraceae bacterium]|nr:tetratricopeptide repeat protein [Steroidobacteraceae bacterium]